MTFNIQVDGPADTSDSDLDNDDDDLEGDDDDDDDDSIISDEEVKAFLKWMKKHSEWSWLFLLHTLLLE